MALQRNALFGDLTFGDGVFGGFPGALSFLWQVQCPDESIWLDAPEAVSVWADGAVNVNEWNEEKKSNIPVNPCRNT